ncbi:MAG: hypothetical protein K0R66_791 [Gammaproteobacteria bacterium]|jgi:hypothetical protein|nr:hypothetical protein [Gammaproteobacteria bacterium]
MKQSIKVCIALISSLLVSYAYAGPFDGFYAGIGANAVSNTMQTSWNGKVSPNVVLSSKGYGIPAPALNFSSSSNDTEWNPALGLLIGYGQSFGQYYTAAEVGYISNTKTMSSYGTSQTFSSTSFNYHNQASLSDQFNIGIKLGRLITPNDLVYLRPAISYAKMSYLQEIIGTSTPISIAAPPSASGTYQLSNASSSIWGEQIGLGYEHAFTSRFAVEGELTYVSYASNTVTGGIIRTATVTGTTSFKPYAYLMGISAIYHF